MSVQASRRASWRVHFAFLVLCVIAVFLAMRLFYWQILQWEKLSALAKRQQTTDASIPARRGDIRTRDGLTLATDVFLFTISTSPKGIPDPMAFARIFAPVLKQTPEAIVAKLKVDSGSVVLARDAPLEVGTAVQDLKNRLLLTQPELGLVSLQIQKRAARQYPAKSLAAQVVGYVNAERRPASGIELFKDGDLRGIDGLYHGAASALRNDWIPFDLPSTEPAVNGADIVLTIDSGIQRIAETELARGVRDSRATGGSLLVLDPKTGDILAMAVYPTADLNLYYDPANISRYTNSTISAQYEPGSVFKIVTLAAALDAGTITPSTTFDDDGSFPFGGITVRNHDNLAPGRVTLTDVMRQSLNVEAAKISVGLGVERFYQYVSKFGFGSRTRVELAAEAEGDVKSAGDGRWRDADLAVNAYGQGIAVTPLQMAAAVAAVANQGRLMRPHVIREIRYPNGQVAKTEPQPVRQAVRPETAQTTTRILMDSILGESDNKAAVPGFRIAGKTGTAQIPVFGAFDPRWTIASFVGYLPATDPRFVILVKLDRPQTSEWGSQVASPVFAAVAKQLVGLAAIPPDGPH
jgi:cell division protein FtsI/penicillin-binding protein 2